jgi:hypothetical protein
MRYWIEELTTAKKTRAYRTLVSGFRPGNPVASGLPMSGSCRDSASIMVPLASLWEKGEGPI